MTRAWHRSMKQLVIWRMAMTSPRDRNGWIERGPCGVPVRGARTTQRPVSFGWLLVLLLCLPACTRSRVVFCMHRLCVVVVVVSFIYSLPLKLSEWVSKRVSGRVNEQPWRHAATNDRSVQCRARRRARGGGPFVVVVVCLLWLLPATLLHLVTGLVSVFPIGKANGGTALVNGAVVSNFFFLVGFGIYKCNTVVRMALAGL